MAQKVACTETNMFKVCTRGNLSTFVKISAPRNVKTNLLRATFKNCNQYEEEENQFEFVKVVLKVAAKHLLKTR